MGHVTIYWWSRGEIHNLCVILSCFEYLGWRTNYRCNKAFDINHGRVHVITKSQNSVTGTVTRLQAGKMRNLASIPTRNKRFFTCVHNVQKSSEAHPASYAVRADRSFLPGVKWPGHDTDQPPPSCAEVKNECNYTCTSPQAFMTWTQTNRHTWT